MDTENPADTTPSISLKEAKRLYDNRQGEIFVDVRTRYAYDELHIPGADSLPLDYIQQQWQAYAPDQKLILYDDAPDDPSAEAAAAFLKSKGFTNLRVMDGGLDGWQDSGYPVDRERTPEEGTETGSEFTEAPS